MESLSLSLWKETAYGISMYSTEGMAQLPKVANEKGISEIRYQLLVPAAILLRVNVAVCCLSSKV